MTHKITINTNPQFRPLQTVSSTALTVLVIGVGVVADSAAMQWAGFVSLLLTVIGLSVIKSKKDDCLTIDEARKRLDEIEAEERDAS